MKKDLVRFVPDRSQRIAAVKDIVYEYANFISAAHHSIHGHAPWRTNCDDAFLLGCRKLDDFLTKADRLRMGNVELDDVLARDYLSSATIPDWVLPIWSVEWRAAMNKQLAHISYTRDKEWNHDIWVPQLRREFETAWWKFRAAVTDDSYNQEFERQTGICQAKPGFENVPLGST
jgi:hypothetical protein